MAAVRTSAYLRVPVSQTALVILDINNPDTLASRSIIVTLTMATARKYAQILGLDFQHARATMALFRRDPTAM